MWVCVNWEGERETNGCLASTTPIRLTEVCVGASDHSRFQEIATTSQQQHVCALALLSPARSDPARPVRQRRSAPRGLRASSRRSSAAKKASARRARVG
eukprot:4109432-Pleurochrysis_carterae.AAC.2